MTSILLIDDESGVRESVAKVLGREGYEVETVGNAEAGLKLLAERDFDVLITDIIMPGIDGVEAIRRAREHQPGLKIIAISGGGNFGTQSYRPDAITTTAYLHAAAEAGADSVSTKPFERATLVESVRRVFEDE